MADSSVLRDELRRLGHVGGVETFAGRVRVSRSGEVRVLEPGEEPAPSQDSVVLATPGSAIAFPFTPNGPDSVEWEFLHLRMPVLDGVFPPVHVYAHAVDGELFVDDEWQDGASFAAALVDAGLFQHDPRSPLHLVIDLPTESRQHVDVVREVARSLRGDGPYREVFVNTAPLRIDPDTGLVDLSAAGFERVSEVLITDVEWAELIDGDGRPHGAALMSQTRYYPALVEGARFADDYNQRLGEFVADTDNLRGKGRLELLPWASTLEAGRARPFVVHLESRGRSYDVRLHDGRVFRLSAREVARLLASPAFQRALTDPEVRRPLALITRTATPNGALNRELLDLLMQDIGIRAYYEYSGPVRAESLTANGETRARSEVSLSQGVRFTNGWKSLRHGVPVRWDGAVFALAEDADLGPDLVGIARGVARGEFGDEQWGAQLPLVVAVRSTEGYAVAPTADGGRVEVEAGHAFQVLFRNGDFHSLLETAPDQPLVLVGEDAGTRVGFGGFGFDFASALHASHDFRDVYAMTRDENGDPVFTLVSRLRDEDLALEPLEDSTGRVVAVVVRSAGDEAEVEHAREWAGSTSPRKMRRFWNSTAQRYEETPWPAGKQPLLILAAREADRYLATRSDGEDLVLSMVRLTGVLRDSALLRDAAGSSPKREFVFAALGGQSIRPWNFATRMLDGGYARPVHWPDGRLVLHGDGRITVHGNGFRTVERIDPGSDDFVTYPLVEAGTGRIEGQMYPTRRSDLWMMQASRRRESAFGFRHYLRQVVTRAADGSVERHDEKLPMKWTKRLVPPWYVDMHGRPDRVTVRLRTGRPLALGDEVELSPEAAARVLTRNRIYRSVPHPRGEEKVATVCSINRAPDEGGHPLASYLVGAFEEVDGFPVTVWAADQDVATIRLTGRRTVEDNGFYRRAVRPGDTAVESSDEDFSDTDSESGGPGVRVSPVDVERVVLRDGSGGVVGAGFLAGGEAGVVVEAFASGAGGADAGVFSVVAHRGPEGVRVPLKSGGFRHLDDRAFVRLLVGMRLFAPDAPVRFLMCGVTDSAVLRDELRRLGHVGGVETFAGRVRVSRSGEVRVLEPDEQPGSPQDSVVLAGPGRPIMFPIDQSGQDVTRWKFLHNCMPATTMTSSMVYAHARASDGWLFADGQWRDAESFAAALIAAGVSQHSPRTQLIFAIEVYSGYSRHVDVVREVVRLLRGDGPYRDVIVNTAALRANPQAGVVDFAANGFERVSDLRITDVDWQELVDGNGHLHGAAVLDDPSYYRGLLKGVRFVNDYNLRIARLAADVTNPYEGARFRLLPWTMSVGGNRVRPFVMYLVSRDSHYVIRSMDGQLHDLSAREMARLLVSPAFRRAFTDPHVRRPLVLVTDADVPNSALNRELLDLLVEEIGVRTYFEYSGPVGFYSMTKNGEVAAAPAELILSQDNWFTSGPELTQNVVSVQRHEGVFALADDARLGAELVGVVRGVVQGTFDDRPWGEVSPLVVAVSSTEGYAVVPTVDGGQIELGGEEVFYALPEEDDSQQSSEPAPDRPVVLVGEDTGTRVGVGGFGFDFASALHMVDDFRDVYAMTRDERGRPVFALVSGLRGGDIELESLENSAGNVVAVVVRSAGDEAEVEDARQWAYNVTSEKVERFWNAATGRFEDSPWSMGPQPLLILATRQGEQYLAMRLDGVDAALSVVGLTGALNGSELVRRAAGYAPDVDFVFAALGDASVEPVGFGAGMLAGGYSRRVHWPDGRLALWDDGGIAVQGGGFRTVERVEPGVDDFVTYPIREAVTGRTKGQVYPDSLKDLLVMPSINQRAEHSGFRRYIREVTIQTADGGVEYRDEKLPMKWTKRSARTWQIVVHGEPGSVAVRLRTGHPFRFGDQMTLSPQVAARVMTRNEIYRSTPHPQGEQKVTTACSINRVPDGGGHPLASYLVGAFEEVDGFPATVWAADQVVEVEGLTGRRSVLENGFYRRAVRPGEEAVDSSDEDFSDTDSESGVDTHSGVSTSFDAPAPRAVLPERVVLRDGLGGVVGAGFLSGGEAQVVVEAFASGAGVPGVFSVVAHRGPEGVRVPLKSGGFEYLGDRAFVRLLVGMRLFAPDVPVRFLMCGVADSGALRDELRRLGHVGGVETFAGRVRVSRSGEVRVLDPDEQPGSPQDSVVLADPGPVIAFPAAPNGQDVARWRNLYDRVPTSDEGPPPVYVFAHAHHLDGRLFANGQWRDAASFADALVEAGISQHDPRAQLIFMVEVYSANPRHVDVVQEVARLLRGDGPYRDVSVNTASLQIDPHTGLVDVASAGIERVSEVLITDVDWQELIDGNGRLHGAAMLDCPSYYQGLVKGVRFVDDYNLRVARLAADVTRPYHDVRYSLLPWTMSVGDNRVRPFMVYLASQGPYYVVRLVDGRLRDLSVPEMARLLVSPAFQRALTEPHVRRPLVLITDADVPNSALNQELLDLLMEQIGVRPHHEYSGPVGFFTLVNNNGEVVAAPPELVLSRDCQFTSGSALTQYDVSTRKDGGVFALAEAADLGPDLVGIARDVARGAFGDQPWGEASPLVVAVLSGQRTDGGPVVVPIVNGGYVVVPTLDGGHLELGGQEVLAALAEEEDFRQEWVAEPGRPVVLVGEDAGTRVNPGGFGFDFASMSHASRDFRDVYAMTRDERGRPVFRLVSGLRAGDVALEPLRNSAGNVVAVVVRSAGDEVEFERARRWAHNATVGTIRHFWNATTGRFEDSPWSAGRRPLLVLATRQGERYPATRSDGVDAVLSVDGLTGALHGSELVRKAAGFLPDVDFVFAALGDASVEPVGFGAGMLAGGYSRRVHWPDGRLVLRDDGQIAVEGGGFRTVERVEPGVDDFVTYPIREAVTGRTKGQVYPNEALDFLYMPSIDQWSENSGFRRYIREVTVQAADGGVERRDEKLPMKWTKRSARTWQIVVHGEPDSVDARLRTGHPFRFGDRLALSSEVAARVLTRNSVYRSVPHPQGEQKVASACSINRVPDGGGHPLASHLVKAFEEVDGFPATVWAADRKVEVEPLTGRRSVKDAFDLVPEVGAAQQAQQLRPGRRDAGQGVRDGRGVPQHVLDDHLDVLDQQVAEPGDLLRRQVVPRHDLAQVGVEVAHGRGQLGVLEEQRGDLLGQHLARTARAADQRLRQRLPEPVQAALHGGQQLARHLPRALGHAQQLVHVPLHPDGELADLVADAAVLELRDAGGHHLAPALHQVAPLDQLPEAVDHVLDARLARLDPALPLGARQRPRDLARGQVRQQRRREQPHDRQVRALVVARVQVGVELEAAGWFHGGPP
ncbi:hypothetical protein AB0G02_17800 [Actinosynnema sp. NPDC023658]|uniref:hypothetical protein n=1 Tax=Actinosynnema sp. NPDC023658 TaxID=3155465 RepID=UPI0033D5CF7F